MMSRIGRWIGIVMQALIVGLLLFVALVRLAGMVGGARVFQYQGF